MPRLPAMLAAALLAGPAAAAPPDHVWIDGEGPSRTTFNFSTGGWGHADRLAGGKWLFAVVEPNQVADKVPDDGAGVAYDFNAPAAGNYDVWARVGYEFARAPFRWRVGDRPWATVGPDDLTTDLMAIADSAEVAWLKLGRADLTAGKHALEFRVMRPAKGVNGKVEYQRLLFGLDAVCLSRGGFRPNGPFRPDDNWRTPIDRQVQYTAFEFPTTSADPADRRTLDLGGVWEVARFDEPGDVADRTGPVKSLPADLDSLFWRAIRVPGDKDAMRPEWAYCHRFLYRTRIRVPKDAAGRSFVLRFPNNALLTTVFVNGTPCGSSHTPAAAWDCDITAAVKPGEVNELVVGVKDLYYAVSRTAEGKSCRWLFNLPTERFHAPDGPGPARFADFPVLGTLRRSGILETPVLTVGGPAYTADVFCKPSVARKELGLEVTIRNTTAAPVEAEVRNEVRPLDAPAGPPAKAFAPVKVTVPAGGSEVVKLTEAWADAKLWWPDDPRQYTVTTTLAVAGRPADRVGTKFGFREWGWTGPAFTLNGIPWHLRADLRGSGPEGGAEPAAAVKEWRKHGQNTFRFWGDRPWTGRTQQETLDFFDASGVIVRRSGTFDGSAGGYQLVIDGKPHGALFDHWREQLAAWVKTERNHPSVLVWSVENEVTSTNARDHGWREQVEPEVAKAAREVMALDPTRPAMSDGGGAAGGALPVVSRHERGAAARDFPDPPDPAAKPFAVDAEFAPADWPAAFAAAAGAATFADPRGRDAAAARLARVLSEGYRWRGVAAFQFGFAAGPDAEHYKAWQPVCALCRERDAAWPGGATVTRTLKAFNDTRAGDPVTVHWLFQTRGLPPVTQFRGKKELALPPGGAAEFAAEIDLPAVSAGKTVLADFFITCTRGGKEVYRDITPVRVVGPDAAK